jgi:hypothetical protein
MVFGLKVLVLYKQRVILKMVNGITIGLEALMLDL